MRVIKRGMKNRIGEFGNMLYGCHVGGHWLPARPISCAAKLLPGYTPAHTHTVNLSLNTSATEARCGAASFILRLQHPTTFAIRSADSLVERRETDTLTLNICSTCTAADVTAASYFNKF